MAFRQGLTFSPCCCVSTVGMLGPAALRELLCAPSAAPEGTSEEAGTVLQEGSMGVGAGALLLFSITGTAAVGEERCGGAEGWATGRRMAGPDLEGSTEGSTAGCSGRTCAVVTGGGGGGMSASGGIG